VSWLRLHLLDPGSIGQDELKHTSGAVPVIRAALYGREIMVFHFMTTHKHSHKSIVVLDDAYINDWCFHLLFSFRPITLANDRAS